MFVDELCLALADPIYMFGYNITENIACQILLFGARSTFCWSMVKRRQGMQG
jgi:hypothetical protein